MVVFLLAVPPPSSRVQLIRVHLMSDGLRHFLAERQPHAANSQRIMIATTVAKTIPTHRIEIMNAIIRSPAHPKLAMPQNAARSFA